ncbi:MAG: two-component sensor histidine kinase [Microcoleus sp. PH2017_07_MST_O_A]|uniref:two-component system sensor histidine kinase RppB n=1 Tax=unclassified Microcoleus TaxID=2642155 RepID=UPI001DE2E84A|nr:MULTISPECIES: two-component system sensor histidine kinase RppB [unclassified Microcoleus]MCC3417435.1 two-component sensor histidine kinase [Microcoleus sp. PH2017_07_MST_O_A]MCC3511903.1 two-component sensor histidine kinase [Microcoleus sp. PH2017_17_BER_D_A]MCC3573986.1 two-component sensor histidine kinase [Microcoleus sp. PH2017_34_RAT_O_A]MCC3586807.1 two-component sensor histidine kinase [Microcoleus sp. PH2017_30_WIL_O_A]MCC3590944.1 two-component sensor histidine kinase [Microcole
MNQNKLFNRTRSQLAISYAAVMGLILSLLGFGVYKAIAHAHWIAIDRELESVAGTLHDSLEIKLQQPGRLEPIVNELLPNLRVIGVNGVKEQLADRHILSAINQSYYYIRLFDSSGKLIATAGAYPETLPPIFNSQHWQTIADSKGNIYHQISVSLHTNTLEDWGYFQVGRSLQDFNSYLSTVRLILKLGLPTALILVVFSSWWLAGLAMKPIYSSYRQIQQFTADAAHELRTPLAASQATVESALLMPQLDEKEAREILQTVDRQNRRLTQLVTDLLLLARMDSQVKSVSEALEEDRPQLCCLNDLVGDLVEELAALARSSQVALTSEIRVQHPLNVVGDADRLYRLVTNLIVNAIQYTPPGGKVTVILDCTHQEAIIQVQDTGIGIAAADLGRIFDRFYRVNKSRSRHTGGSGLGLAIARAIARAHRGSLSARSELGSGSTFLLRLPL